MKERWPTVRIQIILTRRRAQWKDQPTLAIYHAIQQSERDQDRSVRAKDTLVRTVIEETHWNVPSGRKCKRCDSSVFHRRIFHGSLMGHYLGWEALVSRWSSLSSSRCAFCAVSGTQLEIWMDLDWLSPTSPHEEQKGGLKICRGVKSRVSPINR